MLSCACDTRPDISYAVGYVSCFMEVPTTQHFAAVKSVAHVASPPNWGCHYSWGSGDDYLVCYNDNVMTGDLTLV